MMKKQHDLLSILLAAVTAVLLVGILVTRAFFPRVILPEWDGTLLISLSLVALVLDHYLAHRSRRNYWLLPLYAALIFGVFPLAALAVLPLEALKLGLLGALIFPIATFLFDSMVDRLSKEPIAKAAPVICALGLYLATQCLVGII